MKALRLLKKIAKIFFITVFSLLIIGSIFAVATGRTYLFRAVYYTYLHGQSGPGIQDKDYFYYREIHEAVPQPWPTDKYYAKVNLNPSQIKKLEDYKTTSFLVFHKDALLLETYFEDFNFKTVSNSFSMAKSIVSICIGIAIDEGKIKDENQFVSDFIPSFKEGEKSKLTLKHLLTMSGGLDWSESGGNPLSNNAEAYYGTDLKSMIEEVNVVTDPGKKFDYQSGATLILGYVVELATGQKLSHYASDKIWKKIGAENIAYWSLDAEDGLEKSYCCYYATARDFARFGKLYLHHGIWHGDTIVSPEWVQKSISPADLLDEDGSKLKRYGYSWWMTDHKGEAVYYMRGILGQYVICMPESEIVIVRTGHKRGEKRGDQPLDIYDYMNIAQELVAETE